ncbi:MAG: RpiB/LacA/LacB family sugar-phosphate isomerase [Candidatus Saccharibacteria bacterium]|nr:RpiB/LacA/LacB family sugar-phosphate isomerase [Candidatus Saccharibacteria bacterium]
MGEFKRIFIGSDHNGFNLKAKIKDYLVKNAYDVVDVGGEVLDPNDDFPDFAARAATAVLTNDDSAAILICGGGQGMCMAANRFKGIRASVLWDEFEAKMTRNDNDANICCLPARLMEKDLDSCYRIIDQFLTTKYAAAPRYNRRNALLDNMN